MEYGGVIPENRGAGRMKKNFNLKEGMATGLKLVGPGSNKIRDEIHVGKD